MTDVAKIIRDHEASRLREVEAEAAERAQLMKELALSALASQDLKAHAYAMLSSTLHRVSALSFGVCRWAVERGMVEPGAVSKALNETRERS